MCKPLSKVVHMTKNVNLNFCFSNTSLIYTIKICSSIINNITYPHKALCYAQRTLIRRLNLTQNNASLKEGSGSFWVQINHAWAWVRDTQHNYYLFFKDCSELFWSVRLWMITVMWLQKSNEVLMSAGSITVHFC